VLTHIKFKLLICLVLAFNSNNLLAEQSNHQKQLKNPAKMHEVIVDVGVTKVVAASLRDLNAIYTPFIRPTVIKKSGLNFERLNNVLYFQPDNEKPVGVYITEADDPSAPIYKLTIVPSKVPVGQQITLVPKNNRYFSSKKVAEEMKASPDYPSFLIKLLADTAKSGQPGSFAKDDEFESPPFFIGNVLLSPSYRMASSNYEIIVLEASNRNNETIQLSESDFSELSPATGLVNGTEPQTVAAIGFYPRIVLQPNATTFVYLIRARDYD
jgi:hypothetical protein